MKIQLKRSSVLDGGVAKAPLAEQMEFGELAINYNAGDPALFVKDSAGNIVKSDLSFDKNAFVKVIGDNMTGDLTLGSDKITLDATSGNVTANKFIGDGSSLTGLTPPGDGTITVVQPGTTDQTFTVDQTGNTTITLKNDNTQVTPGNGTITVVQPGTTNQTFSVNQAGNTTITLKNDNTQNAVGNGTITIVQPGTSNQTFTVNQSGNTTINLKNDNTQVTPGNGALTIRSYGHNANGSGSFTANQSSGSIITLPQIRYADLSGTPSIPSAANNGQINVNASTGISISGSNATANQSGNTTRTVALDTGYTDGRYLRLSGGTISGSLTVTGNIQSNSDIRLKTNIQPLENTLEKVCQLRGVRYDRTDIKEDNCIGVIAQEVEEVYPEFVGESKDGIKSVEYSKLVSVLIEAVKDLKAEIATIKKDCNC